MKTKYSLFVWIFFLVSIPGFGQLKDPLAELGPRVFKPRTQADFIATERVLGRRGKEALAAARRSLEKMAGATFTVGANRVLNTDPKILLNPIRENLPTNRQLLQREQQFQEIKRQMIADFRKLSINLKDFIQFSTYKAEVFGGSDCEWNIQYLTPVKNQGNCGSCWAFATAATYEHTYRKFYSSRGIPDLSEQDLVDCAKASTAASNQPIGTDAGGCGGGWSAVTMDYITENNAATEANYPYRAVNGTCPSGRRAAYEAYYWGVYRPGGNTPTIEQVKYAVSSFGAVTTYMDANHPTFFAYAGGVYNGIPNNPEKGTNHAVTIVGWCDAKNAWIIKNSWGSAWGPYGGYAYIDYNSCNIGKFIAYILPKYAAFL